MTEAMKKAENPATSRMSGPRTTSSVALVVTEDAALGDKIDRTRLNKLLREAGEKSEAGAGEEIEEV